MSSGSLTRSWYSWPAGVTSTVHPVASAAAWKQARTFARNTSRRALVAERTYHSERV